MRTSISDVPFPRIVAHRGASGELPENTLPAFKLALEQGAQEVEFDLRTTADNEIVVCHDPTLDRTTTGDGAVAERTWRYIRGLDAGVWRGSEWEGTHLPRFEEVFEFVAGRAIMNIHTYDAGKDGFVIDRIRELAEARGVADQVYVAAQQDVLVQARRKAPDITRCCLQGQKDGDELMAWAQKLDCARLQFYCEATTDEHIRRALDRGLIVNYFYCDDSVEAKRLLDVGVMALLTNVPGRMRHLVGV